MTHTDWLPGILVLGLGLLAAGAVLFLARRRSAPAGPAETRRAGQAKAAQEAELRSARLLDQLRELEADRHHLSPAAYQAESARLEQLAAKALRARDEARTTAANPRAPGAVPVPAPSGFFASHPQLAGAVWGAGLAVFFGALFLWVTRDAAPREKGEGLTGTAGRGEASLPPPEDSAFSAALARVRDEPGDVEASAHVVHELIRRQDYDEARLLTERSLGVDPFQSEARTHRAFLLAAGGDTPGALKELQHLSELYPHGYEALLFLGLVRMRSGDNAGAADAFDRFLVEAPPDEQPPQMRASLTTLRQQLRSPK